MADTSHSPLPLNVKDIQGQTFTRLTVLEYAGQKKHNAMWLCVCSCGGTKIANSVSLKNGDAKSCGCLLREYRASLKTHGETNTPEFKVWSSIKSRTTNPNWVAWDNYGGRGIRMSEDWMKYENFKRDMGPRPAPDLEIDRIDNDGPYSKENCRWATRREQCRNQRTNHLLTLKGETLPIVAWTERLGFRKNTISNRLAAGWSVALALETPDTGSDRKKKKIPPQ